MERRGFLLSGATALSSVLLDGRAKANVQSKKAPKRLPPPTPLRRGARLRAVNPGTWIDPETDFNPLVERLAAEEWTLDIPDSVRRQWRYFSGRDSQRSNDLEAAWNDPTLDGLVYVGAGWGGARVLETGFRFPRRSLWTLGFSDTSSILLAQWATGSRGAIHGSSGGDENQWQRTVNLLKGRSVAPLQGKGVRRGLAVGPLVVTNLTVATHLIGTPWLPHLSGSILVLEDVGEAPYRIDRMLTQWRSSGLLEGVAGIGTGRFSWKGELEPGDFSTAEILEERLGDQGIPLVMNLPVGHGLPNQALPLGVKARLDGNDGTLSIAE